MKEEFGGVMITLFKDRYTEEQLRKMGLNERQVKAVLYVVENGSITNSDYQKISKTSERTALRDLDDLSAKNILQKKGEKKGTYYELAG
jgi:ATP-dependent DNA helicase RecG